MKQTRQPRPAWLGWLLMFVLAVGAAPAQTEDPATTVAGEAIEVRLAAIEVRGIDASGGPLRELTAADFDIRVDGHAVEIDAIEFASSLPASDATGQLLAPLPDPPKPKIVAFLVQSDLNGYRLGGFRSFFGSMDTLLDALGPGDRAAVFAFGSRLELELDLCDDRDLIAAAMRRGARLENARSRPDLRGPLSRRLDPHEAARVVSPEQALEKMALTLVDRDEDIVVILLGWGLGRFGSDGVTMTPSWPAAKAALARIDAPLLVVDIADADFHSLEVALQEGSRATGGAYMRAKDFPGGVAKRLATGLRSTVRVWIRVPADTPREARLEVRLRERAGTLLAVPPTLGG